MNRTVLITGASSGIGQAAAARFLKAGWSVAACMRKPAETAFETAREHPAQFAVITMDVTDEASIEAGVAAVAGRFGGIDVVVNNAGYALMGPIEAISPAQLRRQFETNLLGLASVTRHALPHLRARGGGVVVNISSIGGRMAFPFASAYHATKFAVEGLSEAMRFELRDHRVRVKLVEPGGIRTNFITRGLEWATHPAYEPQLGEFRLLSERMNDGLPGPERVAEVIFRAATDGSGRLRYPASTGPYPLLHALLPDAIWRRLVGMALRRQGGRRRTEQGRPARLA